MGLGVTPATSARAASQAVQVRDTIRRVTTSLGLPEHFAETFHHLMGCSMVATQTICERLEMGTDPGRLVNRQLLGNRQMHREMEKGIACTVCAIKGTLERSLRIVERYVVLGMLGNPPTREILERRERRALTLL